MGDSLELAQHKDVLRPMDDKGLAGPGPRRVAGIAALTRRHPVDGVGREVGPEEARNAAMRRRLLGGDCE